MADIRGVSLCGQAMIVTPQYVRDASGSVLFPDRLLHKLHGRGLAKSTICWISLSPSSSSLYSLSLPLLLSVCFVFPPPHFITNADQKTQPFSDCLHNKSLCWLEQRAPLTTSRHVFLSFCFFRAFVTRHL